MIAFYLMLVENAVQPERSGEGGVSGVWITSCLFVILCFSSAAQAQVVERKLAGTTACLRWIAQPKSGCPTTEEIAASVESVLERQVFVAEDCEIRIRGSISPSSKGGWLARLSFADRGGRSLGTRHLEGVASDCGSMRGPTSLVIALMVESTESTVAVSESVPPEAPVAAPIPLRPTSGEERAFVDLRTSYGLLPGLGLGASLGFDATLSGILPGRFDATVWLPKSSGPGPGGRFWSWHTGLALCPNLSKSERLRLALCGGAQLGLVHATGLNLEDAESPRRPYAHAEARLLLSIPFGKAVAFSTHLAFAVPFLRPRFVYLDDVSSSTEVHQPNSALVLGGVGLVWIDSP